MLLFNFFSAFLSQTKVECWIWNNRAVAVVTDCKWIQRKWKRSTTKNNNHRNDSHSKKNVHNMPGMPGSCWTKWSRENNSKKTSMASTLINGAQVEKRTDSFSFAPKPIFCLSHCMMVGCVHIYMGCVHAIHTWIYCYFSLHDWWMAKMWVWLNACAQSIAHSLTPPSIHSLASFAGSQFVA